MKWIKRAIAAFFIVVLFAVCALLAAAIYIDPNDYKDQIANLVSKQTGHTLNIDGDIKLSIFPWIGLELQQLSLENPQGFSDKHIVALERLNVKAALLPLLKMQVRVGKVELIGLQVSAERRADGATNWEAFQSSAATTPETPAAPAEPSATAPPVSDLYIGGIRIENANVVYRDATNKTAAYIEHFNLETQALRLNKPVGISVEFALRNEQPKVLAGIELQSVLEVDLAANQYALRDVDLSVKASGPPVPGNHQQVNMGLEQLVINLENETLQMDALLLETVGIDIRSSLQANHIMDEKFAAKGQLQLNINSVRSLLGQLAIPAPITSESDVLGSVELQSAVSAGADSIALDTLAVVFDKSVLNGKLSIAQFAKPVVRFDLALDQINVDDYLPPIVEAEAATNGSDETANEQAKQTPPTDTEIALPTELLRNLDLQGALIIGSMQAMNLSLSQFEAVANAKSGRVTLDPIKLSLYDGQFSGKAGVDVTAGVPRYSANLDLQKVQFGPLLQDYMDSRFLEGEVNAQANLTAQGTRIGQMMAKLNGNFNFAFRDGAISTSVREEFRHRVADLKAKVKGAAAKPIKAVSQPTKFSSITASGVLSDGVVLNNDLEVKARHIYITGKGKYELPTDYIDYVLTILLSDDGAGQDDKLKDLYDLPINYRLQGKLNELNYAAIALNALRKAAGDKAKRIIEDKKKELEAAAKAKLEQEKAAQRKRLQELEAQKRAELERQKKAAEERARQELERKKDEAKKKLLKKLFD